VGKLTYFETKIIYSWIHEGTKKRFTYHECLLPFNAEKILLPAALNIT